MLVACTGAADPGVFTRDINRGGPVMLDAQTKDYAYGAAPEGGAIYFDGKA